MSQYDLTLEEQALTGFAIKATGRTAHDIDEHGAWFRAEPDPVVGAWVSFNPLRDDGDAFRLMVQLRLAVEPWILHNGTRGTRASFADEWHIALETAERDLGAAVRLAIVQLAAHLYCSNKQRTST